MGRPVETEGELNEFDIVGEIGSISPTDLFGRGASGARHASGARLRDDGRLDTGYFYGGDSTGEVASSDE